jgi:hypothetical protein
MSILLKSLAIEVLIGRTTPAKARSFAGALTLVDGGAVIPYPIRAVLAACEFVEMESA